MTRCGCMAHTEPCTRLPPQQEGQYVLLLLGLAPVQAFGAGGATSTA
jgi:hypothetical protein